MKGRLEACGGKSDCAQVFGDGRDCLGEDLRLLDCVAVDERWREGGGNIEKGSR